MLKDKKGQFTIAGLFALLILIVVTIKIMPIIYQYCEEGASLAESKGDALSAFFWRLIPVSIVIAELMGIYYYAKPLIIRGE